MVGRQEGSQAAAGRESVSHALRRLPRTGAAQPDPSSVSIPIPLPQQISQQDLGQTPGASRCLSRGRRAITRDASCLLFFSGLLSMSGTVSS